MGALRESGGEWKAYVEHAHNLFDVGRNQQGLEFARLALSLAPEEPRALAALSRGLLRTGAAAEAADAARQAIVASPFTEFYHRLHAFALMDLGEYDNALNAAIETARLAPRSYLSHRTLTHAFLHKEELDSALEAVMEAWELAPDNADTAVLICRVHLRRESWVEARQWADEGIRLNPNMASAFRLKAIALHRLDERKAAIDALRESARLDPEDSHTHRLLESLVGEHLQVERAGVSLAAVVAVIRLVAILSRGRLPTEVAIALASVAVLLLGHELWQIDRARRTRRERWDELDDAVKRFYAERTGKDYA